MILPWNRCCTGSAIESKSFGSRKQLPKSEINEPLFGAWQTGHSSELTKQLWQVKCPQLVNEPGTISSPAPQTCLKHIWRKSETNHVPMTKKIKMKDYVPGTNTTFSKESSLFLLPWFEVQLDPIVGEAGKEVIKHAPMQTWSQMLCLAPFRRDLQVRDVNFK